MTVRLRPMTADDLPAVMVLEEELFAPDTWTEAMYRDELSRGDTRYYVVAEFHLEGEDDDEPEDGRAGAGRLRRADRLRRRGARGHPRRGQGAAGRGRRVAAAGRPARRGRQAQPGRAARGAGGQRAWPSASTGGAASRRSAAAAATTSPAATTPSS